ASDQAHTRETYYSLIHQFQILQIHYNHILDQHHPKPELNRLSRKKTKHDAGLLYSPDAILTWRSVYLLSGVLEKQNHDIHLHCHHYGYMTQPYEVPGPESLSASRLESAEDRVPLKRYHKEYHYLPIVRSN